MKLFKESWESLWNDKKYKNTHYWISDRGEVYYEDCNVLERKVNKHA